VGFGVSLELLCGFQDWFINCIIGSQVGLELFLGFQECFKTALWDLGFVWNYIVLSKIEFVCFLGSKIGLKTAV
jgi:hypothetical protein